MLSSNDIREVKFSKSVSGYKQEEVDVFLDTVESDYINYEKLIAEFQSKINTLNQEIEDYKKSQSSIQNVLVSAQRLADNIVEEAKTKGEQMLKEAEDGVADINNRANQISENFDTEMAAKRALAEKEIAAMLENAKKKAEAVTLAAADSVTRQQALFDKIKEEMADFKAKITQSYKEHLELLKELPTTVSMEPKRVAEIINSKIDEETQTEEEAAEVEMSPSNEQEATSDETEE